MGGKNGFEPFLTVPQTVVLPLHHKPHIRKESVSPTPTIGETERLRDNMNMSKKECRN